jgi:hypothetical protein
MLIVLITLPSVASAQVRINEVAWMGTLGNANAEWIELYNQGSDTVSLANWMLLSTSGTPSITLTGSIVGNSFYLLTRTSATILSGVTGDQVYTGALSNSGATLMLADNGGVEVDRVEGGSNWETIGGDNVTKKTPQRGVGGWVTATPTPRAQNAEIAGEDTEDDEELEEESATTTPTTTIGGLSTSLTTPSYTLPKLYLVTGPNRVVPQYAVTPFSVYVYDEKGKQKRSTNISWSFGDGAQETGAKTQHAFDAVGTYLVVVRAENDETSALRTIIVEVEEASVGIGEVTSEGIELINNGDDVLDVSGWTLRAGTKRFVIPPDTALLPHTTVVFTNSVTKLSTTNHNVSLYYAGGRLAVEGTQATVPLLSERDVAP